MRVMGLLILINVMVQEGMDKYENKKWFCK